MKKYKIKDENYYGIDHEAATKGLEGNPTFVGYVSKNGHPLAVYHCKTPNLEKGHKEYVCLWAAREFPGSPWRIMITGFDRRTMAAWWKHDAVRCETCKTVLYSLSTHHAHSCGCPNDVDVDGGRDYLKYGAASDLSSVSVGIVDVRKGTFTKSRKKS